MGAYEVRSCAFMVDGDKGDDGNDGNSWIKPLATIQAGIDLARNAVAKGSTPNNVCEVWVRQGTYYLMKSDKSNDNLVLKGGVHLLGGFDPSVEIGNGRNAAPADFPTIISACDSATCSAQTYHVLLCSVSSDEDCGTKTIVDGFTVYVLL